MVCESVSQKISPSEEDKRKVHNLSTELIKRIDEEARNLEINVNPILAGSVAKDTWIKTNPDIDLFIVFPRTYTNEEIGQLGLKIARKVTGGKGKEQYAEHPYLRAEVEGFQVDFVPSFEIGDATQRISSVDRTPLHTAYIKKKFDEALKKEVRLLKQFLIGINAYGAEIKVRGFSGYLCELLLINYFSFQALLEACTKWKKQHVIDIEHHYPDKKEIKKIFSEPLVVIDPIDSKRNVSAALSHQKIAEFKAAAKAFLEAPNEMFFFPQKINPLSPEELKNLIQTKGTDTLFLIFETPKVPPDTLWGQLYKSLDALKNFLEAEDFKIINKDIWSEEEKTILLFEFESATISKTYKHLGPPAGSIGQTPFLKKYTKLDKIISGPRIEIERWIVELPRVYNKADKLLDYELRNKLTNLGLGKYIANKISQHFELYLNMNITDIYSKNPDFAQFLTKYYSGKPNWLVK